MKRSPISLLLIAAFSISGACLLTGCDTFESDLTPPSVDVSDQALYVLATGETVIDLNTLVSANFRGRLSVTELPVHGSLQNVADGLIRYTPRKGTPRVRDRFELTFFTENNNILNKDTVYINIETDSTKLPCSIYPMPDYVTAFNDNNAVVIDVLRNDLLCGKSVRAEVHRTNNGTLPRYGTAQANGNRIGYNPGASFAGKDTIIYKVTDMQNPASFAYGFVYINRDSVCEHQPADDLYELDTSAESFDLEVFSNDILCDSIDTYTISIAVPPAKGSLSFTGKAFSYRVAAQTDFSDEFVYAVTKGNTQKTARVVLRSVQSGTPCAFKAVNDSLDIRTLSTSFIYIDALKNDQLCDSVKTFTITRQPRNGNAAIDNITRRIRYDRIVLKSDSLQYEICNGRICSTASVYIKQED